MHPIFRPVIALALSAATLLPSAPAMAIEEPRYEVLKSYDDFEIRRYAPTIVAETVIAAGIEEAGSQAFPILAGYIFGKNRGERRIEMTAPVAQAPVKIAMTAPVSQSAAAGGMMVQFTMPREWTMATLPEPLDPRVALREVPGRTVAVIRYSGFWSEKRYAEHLAKLQAALEREGIPWRGEPVWARYNPPMMPWFLRRNEIWLEVAL